MFEQLNEENALWSYIKHSRDVFWKLNIVPSSDDAGLSSVFGYKGSRRPIRNDSYYMNVALSNKRIN